MHVGIWFGFLILVVLRTQEHKESYGVGVNLKFLVSYFVEFLVLPRICISAKNCVCYWLNFIDFNIMVEHK